MENFIQDLEVNSLPLESLKTKPLAPLNSKIQESIQSTQNYLLNLQHPEGYWVAELKADATLPADYILMMHFLGIEDPDKVRKLANFIQSRQLEDGSWNIYPGGPGEISATVKAYTAFKLAGFSNDELFMKKTREAVLRLGGVEKCNSFTKIYLALIGQYEWSATPSIPPELILFPRVLL
jgi:squalene-hopene/tetraprenyl-beta-curcumene cyclase